MDNCSRHSKQVAGVSDMKLLAENIGDLHYETLSEFFGHLERKLISDGDADYKAGRKQLGKMLCEAGYGVETARIFMEQAWQISKPFMNNSEPPKPSHNG